MDNWREIPLSEIVETVIDYRGKTPKKLGGDWADSGFRALSAKNIKTGKIVQPDTIRFVDAELYAKWMKEEIQRGDIIITSEAPFGEVYYWDSDEKIVLSQRLFGLRCKKDFCSKYIYLYMTSQAFQAELLGRATGTTVIGLRQPELLKCKIRVPDLDTQAKIAEILGCVEDKINLNTKLNANLIELASNLHKQWFLDFDFEGFDGKMEESEVGEIPLGWEVKELGMLIDNFDRKRKPLSSRQRQERKGDIPYYGATSIMDYVDDFIFDDIYVLMGEDGSVMKEDGTPFLQYIWGKSWINNHAHVLKGKVFSTEILYLYLLKMNVASIVTGAVQLKISQGNMNSLKVVSAPRELYKRFDEIIQPIFTQLRNIQEQNKRLTTLRNTILPKLMSGEVDLDCIEV